MKLNSNFERKPVIYGNSPVKLLQYTNPPYSPCFSLHWHKRIEMLVIDEGKICVELSSQTITAKQGDIIMINPECSHRGFTTDSSAKYRVIMFELDTFMQNSIAKPRLDPLALNLSAFVPLIQDSEIYALSLQIFEQQQDTESGSELEVLGLIYQLLGKLIKKHCTSPLPAPPSDPRFLEVLEYISQYFCEPLSSSVLCKKFKYDEAYFCRKFKKLTGLNPTDYIKILRLEKARHLLSSSDLCVYDIASECGFSDSNYFCKCFKKHFHHSPGQYRKIHQTSQNN